MSRDLLKQQLEYTLEETNFDDQGELYRGKVRDNYINEDTITMVTTDRISAFDRVLGTVPFKGQALMTTDSMLKTLKKLLIPKASRYF